MTLSRPSCQASWGLFLLLLLCVPLIALASQPRAGSLFKNITQSDTVQEVKPAFTEDGTSVVFMAFTGTLLGPGLPDYCLVLADRDGHSRKTIVPNGVIDYRLGQDETRLTYLKGSTKNRVAEFDLDFGSGEIGWDLWMLDLGSGESTLVEQGRGRELSAGYHALNVSDYDLQRGEIWNPSPAGTRMVIAALIPNDENPRINLFQVEGPHEPRLFLTTGVYLTHHHYSWLPEIVWIDEQSVIVLRYDGARGTSKWSLVVVDLARRTEKTLYASNRVKAFPKMSLDFSKSLLYFQQLPASGSGTELWRLNLATGEADMVYHTEAELGKAYSSPVGSSLVMTQLLNGKFDIIRLDLGLNKLERLAINETPGLRE